jgi:hypothetical protein
MANDITHDPIYNTVDRCDFDSCWAARPVQTGG